MKDPQLLLGKLLYDRNNLRSLLVQQEDKHEIAFIEGQISGIERAIEHVKSSLGEEKGQDKTQSET